MDDKKSWSGWTRDVTMFSLGFVAGAGTTYALGVVTDSIRTEPERQAAQKAMAAGK